MNFEFDEIRTETFAGELCGENSLLGVAHTRSVGEELHGVAVDVAQHIVVGFVVHVDTFHSHRNHFGFGGENGFEH